MLAIGEFTKFPNFIRFFSLTLFVTVLSYNRSISDPSFVSGNFKPEAGAFVFGFFYICSTEIGMDLVQEIWTMSRSGLVAYSLTIYLHVTLATGATNY